MERVREKQFLSQNLCKAPCFVIDNLLQRRMNSSCMSFDVMYVKCIAINFLNKKEFYC